MKFKPIAIVATFAAVALSLAACTGVTLRDSVPADGVTETTVAEPTQTPPQPAGPDYTVTQEAAISSATSYLENLGGFSRTRLIEQLEYEQFSTEDATFAVDTIAPDWNAQAAESAKSYIENIGGFSRGALYDQLAYEGFTPEQIEHALVANGY